MTTKVGIIGIGVMGSAYATHLIDAGFEVIGYEPDPGRGDEFAALGGTLADAPSRVVATCPISITSVPSVAALEAVAADIAEHGGDGVDGAIVMETGTLPIAAKDLTATRGMRTTMGSPIFADHIPEQDSLLVQRLKQAGALIIGKTNTPEFGAGSHTFNPLFGITRNPYNLDKTAGGSSGGAAAALASGMLPLADGSDMGGSLRNPAAFCNVVGFRPSMGRVPHWPNAMAWQSRLGIEGPMARDVEDCALLLSALAGPDVRDPMSIQEDPAQFRQDLQFDFSGTRIGWTPDLGMLPVAKEVVEVCEKSLQQLQGCGFHVELAIPTRRARCRRRWPPTASR